MPNPPPWYSRVPLETALALAGEGYPEEVQLSRDFIAAYIARGEADRWQPVAVESEFAATIGEIRSLTGETCEEGPIPGIDEQAVTSRIDLAAVVNGLLWLVDFKGTLKGRGDYLPAWNDDGEFRLKWQFHVQLHVVQAALAHQARETGIPAPAVGGIIVQRFKRRPPFDVDANPVPISPRVHRDAVRTLIRQVQAETALCAEVKAAADRGDEAWIPSGNLWSCWGWGDACDYRPLCLAEDVGARQHVQRTEFRVLP